MLLNKKSLVRMSLAVMLALGSQTSSFFTAGAYAAATVELPPIKQWTSSRDRKLVETQTNEWVKTPKTDPTEIKIDSAKTAQSIIGFGGAFTDAACYMIDQLDPSAKQKLIDELYSKQGLGLGIGRLCIGSSDYATIAYSYDDGEADPELKRFTIEHDKKWILPILRMARKANPDLYLFASPWSPPGWMKPNKSMLGGCMTRTYMGPYAQYFLKFLRAYEKEGVPVQAVTIQNEVDTDQEGKMPACAWPQEYEMDFASLHLGPLLEKENVNTKIWIIDHNYNLWGRALGELENPAVRKYANAIAWHGYVGAPDSVQKVHNAYPKTDMHWTEGGPDYIDPQYATNWAKWSETFTSILRNWCRSITVWNLALDERGRPNIGPFPCGGLVTINSKSKDISYSGQYWAISHFSKFISPGSTIVSSESTRTDVKHVAAKTPDGKTVVVLTNPGAATEVVLRSGNQTTLVSLPGDSVSTVRW